MENCIHRNHLQGAEAYMSPSFMSDRIQRDTHTKVTGEQRRDTRVSKAPGADGHDMLGLSISHNFPTGIVDYVHDVLGYNRYLICSTIIPARVLPVRMICQDNKNSIMKELRKMRQTYRFHDQVEFQSFGKGLCSSTQGAEGLDSARKLYKSRQGSLGSRDWETSITIRDACYLRLVSNSVTEIGVRQPQNADNVSAARAQRSLGS